MAQLQAQFKRGCLRSLFRAASTQALTLYNALTNYQDSLFAIVQKGRTIGSTASNGHSLSFKMPPVFDQLTQDQAFQLSEEFLAIYTDALTVLNLSAIPADQTQDNNIFNTMLADDRLQSITHYGTDYTAIRFPTYGTGVT